MSKKKTYKKKSSSSSIVEEQNKVYGKATITTLEALEQQTRMYTANMTPEQRMEYLQKLRTITHGSDLSEQEKTFYTSKIKINKPDENI